MEKSHSEKTSAANKSIGFEFQYYYFLNALLNLRTGQSVGLEVKDDVHTELNSERQILVQLKHSMPNSVTDLPANLTTLDGDLWKTLSNWSKVISDKIENRSQNNQQMAFIRKTEFHLASNKRESNRNNFLAALTSYQEGFPDSKVVIDVIKELRGKTTDETIQSYIDDVLLLHTEALSSFLLKIKFELGIIDIIGDIKKSIREKLIPEDRVQEVFERLDSNIRKDNFITIRSGKHIVISFEEFDRKYHALFEQVRTKKLPSHHFQPVICGNFLTERFIQQLIRIGELSPSDEDQIIQYATEKIRLTSSLQKWLDDGYLVSDQIDSFHAEACKIWANAFRAAFRKRDSLAEDDILQKAIDLVDKLREKSLALEDECLSISLSNGEFYNLSNIPIIGWHPDWEKEFKD
jgi:hypothetical protein